MELLSISAGLELVDTFDLQGTVYLDYHGLVVACGSRPIG